MINVTLILHNTDFARTLFGEHDKHIEIVEKHFGVEIQIRGTVLTFKGSSKSARYAQSLIKQLYQLVEKHFPLKTQDVELACRMFSENPDQPISTYFQQYSSSNKEHHGSSHAPSKGPQSVVPKTANQKKYMEAIQNNDVVFGWGSAGSGKTYLAMAMAVQALLERKVDRIVLTRPAVEAGEKLGFLPGDLEEKVNPYLRPLFDALYDMVDLDRAARMIEKGIIEIAPIAFMRGRTLSHSFVILDEAQNTTTDQMKMFLTRLGFDSKAVITGDITQVDLPYGKTSGLTDAIKILGGIEGIGMVEFTEKDVVRHPLVRKIIVAYEKHLAKQR
ncbi:MAG: PhoH family protein [Bdellovibrionota bacterium]